MDLGLSPGYKGLFYGGMSGPNPLARGADPSVSPKVI